MHFCAAFSQLPAQGPERIGLTPAQTTPFVIDGPRRMTTLLKSIGLLAR